jgi:AcrR family transcriptional regulator
MSLRYAMTIAFPYWLGTVNTYTKDHAETGNDTIETHHGKYVTAILNTKAALVAAAVTMLRIAEDTGIGRATLYKYFRGVEEILLAWHQRQMADYLEYLSRIRDRVAILGSGSKLCSIPTSSSPMSPTGTTTPNWRRFFIETRSSTASGSRSDQGLTDRGRTEG